MKQNCSSQVLSYLPYVSPPASPTASPYASLQTSSPASLAAPHLLLPKHNQLLLPLLIAALLFHMQASPCCCRCCTSPSIIAPLSQILPPAAPLQATLNIDTPFSACICFFLSLSSNITSWCCTSPSIISSCSTRFCSCWPSSRTVSSPSYSFFLSFPSLHLPIHQFLLHLLLFLSLHLLLLLHLSLLSIPLTSFPFFLLLLQASPVFPLPLHKQHLLLHLLLVPMLSISPATPPQHPLLTLPILQDPLLLLFFFS